MISHLVQRMLQSVIVLLAVSLIAFVLFQFAGDPVSNMVGQEATLEERAELREKLGLNDPVTVQYVRFIGNALRGDFGISYRLQEPVVPLILERLPATIELALASSMLAFIIGTLLGVLTAIRPQSWLSGTVLTISVLGISLPTFLIGIALIYIFSVELQWLPAFGRGEVTQLGWWRTGLLTLSGLRAIILPALTLAIFQTAFIMRLVRSEMLDVLRQDYVRFAQARGLSDRVIHFRHALRNTLVPVITVVGMMFGSIIAFSVVTESVFQWPGVGAFFIAAVQAVDVPVMSTYLIFIALVFVTINFIVDILYYIVDPRLRLDSRGKGN